MKGAELVNEEVQKFYLKKENAKKKKLPIAF